MEGEREKGGRCRQEETERVVERRMNVWRWLAGNHIVDYCMVNMYVLLHVASGVFINI